MELWYYCIKDVNKNHDNLFNHKKLTSLAGEYLQPLKKDSAVCLIQMNLKFLVNCFFNNGKPKILFQETPLGNNSDIFNEKKTTIITQTEVPLRKSLK
jgi:hypothetical protein